MKSRTPTLLALLVALACLPLSARAGLRRELPWDRLQSSGCLKGGSPADREAGAYVFRNDRAQPATLAVLAIPKPNIASRSFAIAGQVRHEGVQGEGCLELWTVYADASRHFSRTLARSGPMKSLAGDSTWRPFLLPFFADSPGTTTAPAALELNIVLPGPGTVYLKGLELVEYGEGEAVVPPPDPSAWWGDRTGGWIGGVGGSLLGCLGAAIGVLGGRLRARRAVFTLMGVTVGLGLAALALGLAALATSQPYAAYYPPLLLGLLATAIPLGLWRTLRRRYEQAELQKIQVMDA